MMTGKIVGMPPIVSVVTVLKGAGRCQSIRQCEGPGGRVNVTRA